MSEDLKKQETELAKAQFREKNTILPEREEVNVNDTKKELSEYSKKKQSTLEQRDALLQEKRKEYQSYLDEVRVVEESRGPLLNYFDNEDVRNKFVSEVILPITHDKQGRSMDVTDFDRTVM